MKQTPEEKKIQDKMAPGILSLKGFLGNDNRHLHDIILEDKKVLEKLGKTREEIAERMSFFTNQAFENYDGCMIVENKFEVEYFSVRGRVICPFPAPGSYQKGRINFKNLEKDISLSWTPLNIHMIKAHGFFEGIGSANRLEAEILVKALF